MHFTFQRAFRTAVPSIYQPWDLQHRHLPKLFSRRERFGRDVVARTFCSQAEIIIVASSWIKTDLVRQYGLPPEKIGVIPMAPALLAYVEPDGARLTTVCQKYALPDTFAFYPAQTFRHKNHIGLLRALARIRDQHGVTIPLVCSGRINEHFHEIAAVASRLRLADDIVFLGFVEAEDVYALYKLARAVVLPTWYEGWGFPLTEAFLAGIPIACSHVTILPDLAGDAALMFDPGDVGAMADAIWQLWSDDALRAQLVARGTARVQAYSWTQSARLFRAHYRFVGNRKLTQDDQRLLTRAGTQAVRVPTTQQ